MIWNIVGPTLGEILRGWVWLLRYKWRKRHPYIGSQYRCQHVLSITVHGSVDRDWDGTIAFSHRKRCEKCGAERWDY